jgi:hypothetical protein
MDSRYNVYFNGQLLEGQDMASVRNKLGRLFNADEQTLDKLFSGKSQLIKRECDRATALKFKQAIEQAGARPVIKEVPAAPAPLTANPDKPVAPAPAKSTTSAERIAALAQAPDLGSYKPAAARPVEQEPASAETITEGINLAPPGTDVLRPQERQEPVKREVDTAHLALDESRQRLSEPSPPAPSAPDTAHLSMGAAGEVIPTLPADTEPVEPNTDALDLAPADTDFSDCAAPEIEMPALDLSGIDLAPPGEQVLEEKYRKRDEEKPPATGHLSLED